MNYCSDCGARVRHTVPPGDDRPRSVCDGCKTVHYENPKLVVGCIPESNGRILLCRRAIDPRAGFWTLPAGFLENGETVVEGARRETYEEALARVEVLSLFTLLSLAHIGQIYLLFRARLLDETYGVGRESLEVRLFEEREIPWKALAFTTIEKTLRFYFEDRPAGVFPLHIGNIL